MSRKYNVAVVGATGAVGEVMLSLLEQRGFPVGTVHAVAFWFELELAPGIVIANSPGGDLTAWGQAVQFFDADVAAQPGSDIAARVLRSDTRIAFKLITTIASEPNG